MSSILLAAVVQAVMFSTGGEVSGDVQETYTEAHRATLETGKPMVVMVSTEWCPPCQTMKKTVLPRVREHGLLRKVAFAVVNPDRDQKLAREITGGGPIPQLVMFRKTSDGWMRRKLVGGQSVEKVEQFIEDGLADDAASKGSDPKVEALPEIPRADEEATAQRERSDDEPAESRRG